MSRIMNYHEPLEKLTLETLDKKRASQSLREESEAIKWYQQRIEAIDNVKLKMILEHNRDEEKEHAAMLLEWLRRNDKILSKELKDYLFTEKEIGRHE